MGGGGVFCNCSPVVWSCIHANWKVIKLQLCAEFKKRTQVANADYSVSNELMAMCCIIGSWLVSANSGLSQNGLSNHNDYLYYTEAMMNLDVLKLNVLVTIC